MSEEITDKEVGARRLKEYEVQFHGQDRRGIADLYNKWSAISYEQDMEAVEHRGRFVASDKISRAFLGNKESARILDVAAGSGMLAETLLEKGFKLIDALDGSQGMLDLAKPKCLYQKYYCNFIEEIDDVIDNDTYDIVCSLAAIGPGHLEAPAVRQMFRITKPGGLICISGVKERWDGNPEYHERMRNVIEEFEELSKVKMLENSTIVEYYFYKYWHHGIFVLMQKL